jgi:hypothetical protein
MKNIENVIKNIMVNTSKEINYNIYSINYSNGNIKNFKNTKNKILILESPNKINVDDFINYQYYIYNDKNINNIIFLKNFIYLALSNIN